MSAEPFSAMGAIAKVLTPTAIRSFNAGLNWSVDQIKSRFYGTFQPYLENSLRKCSYIKTIAHPNRDVYLKDVYVNLYLKNHDNLILDDQINYHLNVTPRILITGTGGAGKSMIMRHVLLNIVEKDDISIPLFVNLRARLQK